MSTIFALFTVYVLALGIAWQYPYKPTTPRRSYRRD
jgi:hypothetical protein